MIALQPLGADAPAPAAYVAPALSIANARIVTPALDPVRSRIAQPHAVKRVGAPVLVRRDRPWRPVRGGDRRVHELKPGFSVA